MGGVMVRAVLALASSTSIHSRPPVRCDFFLESPETIRVISSSKIAYAEKRRVSYRPIPLSKQHKWWWRKKLGRRIGGPSLRVAGSEGWC